MPEQTRSRFHRFLRPSLAVIATGGLLASCAQPAEDAAQDGAEDYPTETVEFTIPFSPGGGTDNYLRQLLPAVSEELGVEFRIQNVPGVGGFVGMRQLANAEPDGYTVGAYNPPATNVAAVGTCDNEGVNLAEDLTPVGAYAVGGWVMITEANAPVEDYEDVIQKYQSGEWEVLASETVGGAPQIIAELMRTQDNLNYERYVGYEGGEIAAAVLRGEAPVGILTDSAALSAVESGDAKVVSVLYEPGSEFYPDVETTKEQGYSDYTSLAKLTRSVFVPTGTATEKVDTLTAAFETATEDEEVQQWAEETNSPISWMGSSAVQDAVTSVDETLAQVDNLEELLGC